MRVSINGTNLNVLEQGSGPLTLVFMHYFGGSALEWKMIMGNLADQYRCIAVDLRGCGDSDAPHTGYSIDGMADDIADLLKTLQVKDFVLVGHSMSGKVALALAARQPTGLQALILSSPSPPEPEPIPDDERQKLLQGHGKRSSAQQTLKNITSSVVSAEIQEQIIADDLRTSKAAWDAWLEEGSKETISDRMALVTVPVSIIVGAEDHALPPDVQDRLVLPYLKHATVEVIDGAGHLLPWEKPDVLTAFIQKKTKLVLS